MHDEPRLARKILAKGASGYIVKNATREEFLASVHTVYRFEDRVVLSVLRNTADRLEGSERNVLSSRELEVLLLVARAMSNSRIASPLHISEDTVKRHLSNIYARLGVSSRADATKNRL